MPGGAWNAAKAGLAYFLAVFVVGFVLGTARVLAIEPAIGGVGAVLLELPVMLALSWFFCRWLVRHFAVPTLPGQRLLMGVLAFTLLQVGEATLSSAFGQAPADYVAGLATTKGLFGVAGQIAFGLFPLLVKD